MIKGVRIGGMKAALAYHDTLHVPIIENTPNEEDLKDEMANAMKNYPDAAAVLVRRHGIYVWGKAAWSPARSQVLTISHQGSDWEKAKTQTEVSRTGVVWLTSLVDGRGTRTAQCLDYLFEIAIKMRAHNLPLVNYD